MKMMVMKSVPKCMGCLEFHTFIAGGSDKVKHQNVQTEAVEIKDQYVQAKAIPKEKSMLHCICDFFYFHNTFNSINSILKCSLSVYSTHKGN